LANAQPFSARIEIFLSNADDRLGLWNGRPSDFANVINAILVERVFPRPRDDVD
jgi:hypothetical protein